VKVLDCVEEEFMSNPRQSAKPRPRKRPPTRGTRKSRYVFPVVIERDEDGYFASCLSLPGCSTQGDSYEETLANIKEAVELYLESLLAHGEEIPANELVSLTTVEVEA
jgi:predicted RNase H-like HicB family nuclease